MVYIDEPLTIALAGKEENIAPLFISLARVKSIL